MRIFALQAFTCGVLFIISTFPLPTSAATGPFAPGTVTDPGCLPSDPLCIITTSTSSFTTLTSQTIAASSSVITAATSTSLFSSVLSAVSGWFSALFADSLTAINATVGTLTATSSATLATTTISGDLMLSSVPTGTPTSTILTINPFTGMVEQVSVPDILSANTQNSLNYASSSGILTSTVNGITATTSLGSLAGGGTSTPTANSLFSGGNTITSVVNGVSATSSVISSNTLTYSSSTGLLSSAVNGINTSTTIIPNLSTSYGILGIANGGTGTTIVPTFGQLLMGNGIGGYNLVATSTLGFSKLSQFTNDTNYITSSSAPVQSVFGRTGTVTAQSGDYSTSQVTEGSNLYYTDTRSRSALSSTATGLSYTSGNGVLSLSSGYGIPLSASTTEWSSAYSNRITTASSPLLFSNNTLTIQQAGTSQAGYLSASDWNIFNTKQAALTFTYPLQNSSNVISLAFGTSTSNTWGGTQTFTNTITGSISGNAGTATKLATARTINGVSFDGTSNITITAASSTLLSDNNIFTGTNSFATTTITNATIGNFASLLTSNTTNVINYAAGVLTSTINGIVSTTSLSGLTSTTTNTLTSSGNILTSSVSGITATTSAITSNTLSTTTNTFATVINGISSAFTNIINSLSLSLSGNTLTANVNGVTATSSVISSNTLTYSSSTGLLSSAVNGINTSTTIIPNLSTSYGILGIANGGTGTTTAPTFGQLLIGNGSGGYNLVSTSTLGFNNYWTLSGSNLYNNSGTKVGIGTTTPGSALTVAGTAQIANYGSNGLLSIDGSAGFQSILSLRTDGVQRWFLARSSAAETGSNAGSDFNIQRYSDAGAYLGAPLTITRATGYVGVGTSTPTAQFTTTGTVQHFGLANSTTNTTILTTDSLGNLASSSLANLLSLGSTTLATTYFAQGGNSFGANAVLGTNDNYPLLFETNGGTRMTILANGNVGIGTSTPTVSLDVNGVIRSTGYLTSDAGGTEGGQLVLGWADVFGTGQHNGSWNIDSGPLDAFRIFRQDAAGVTQTALTIATTTGNVGINTLTATDKLSLFGNLKVANAGSQYALIGLGDPGNAATGSGAYIGRTLQGPVLPDSLNLGGWGGITFNTNDFPGATTTPKMVITQGGNVGIGTTTPSDILDIFRNSANYVRSRITNTTPSGGSGFFFGSDVDPQFHSYIVTNNSANSSLAGSSSLNIVNSRGDIGFFAASNGISERMRITSAGNVGIGTTTPFYQLQIQSPTVGTPGTLGLSALTNAANQTIGQISFYNTGIATETARIGSNRTATNYAGTLNFFTYNGSALTQQMIIDTNGNVGIGTTTPTAQLTTTGTVRFAGYTTPGTFSHDANGNLTTNDGASFKDFGAVGDGSTDDTTAVSNALNSGRPITCHGTYRITSQITVSLNTPGEQLSLEGSGRSGCVIKEDGTNAFIRVDLSYEGNPFGPTTNSVLIKNVTLSPNTHVAHGALELYGVAASGSTDQTFQLDGVNVLPTTTGNYSDNGIYLKDMRNGTIANSVIQGRYATFTGSGIYITSSSGSAPVDFHLHDNILTWWNKGLDLEPNTAGTTTGANDWEGVYVNSTTFLATNYGIYAATIDNSSDFLTVTDSHFNFSQYGIYALNIQNLKVSGNYFLASSVNVNSPSTTYGIYAYMNNGVSQYGNINDNSFIFTGALSVPTRYDIYASQASGNIATNVHDNTSIYATVKFASLPTNPSPHNNTGFDYAEMYPVTDQSIIAGHIVAVDTGAPIAMTKALAGSTQPLIGVVSSNPGYILGTQEDQTQRPIALSGRVPTFVNLEAGPIKVGDRIAPSSEPGVGKKAGPFDTSVGIALEEYDGSQSPKQVMVFMNVQPGIDINALSITLLPLSSSTTSSGTTPTQNQSAGSTVSSNTTIQSVLDTFIRWFANTANGIGDFFAQTIHARDQLCVGSVCVTEQQFAAMYTAAVQNGTLSNTQTTPGTNTIISPTPTAPSAESTTTIPTILLTPENTQTVVPESSLEYISSTSTNTTTDTTVSSTTSASDSAAPSQ